jgi:hypothetical protein
LASALLCLASNSRAQAPADPSGHWEGSVQAPGLELQFEVDMAKNSQGVIGGTIGIPQQQLKGLPLLEVKVAGTVVSFHARRDQPFDGWLAPDGQSMSGDYSIEGFTVPFRMTRTGDARIEAPLTSPRIAADLEGTWNAIGDVNGRPVRLTLTMTNHPDGTATGRVVNLNDGGLELPIAIAQKDSSVTLEVRVVASSFSGVLNSDRTELAGTWTQGPATLPLTFRRAGK